MIRHFFHTRHISRISASALALLFAGMLIVPPASGAITPPSTLSASASTELPTIRLQYQPQDTAVRFVLEFPNTPQYTIDQTKGQTQIHFTIPYRLESTTLSNYPLFQDIRFQKISDNDYVLSFPQELMQNFQQSNQLILDFGHPASPASPALLSAITPDSSAEPLPPLADTPPPTIKSLSFSWNIPTNIAVFQRNQYLWIAFDHTQNIDIAELKASGSSLIKEIVQLPSGQGTVIRILPSTELNVGIRREGLLWIVDLSTGPKSAETKALPVFTQYDGSNHSYLFIPTANAGNVISIFDPEVGDVISIVPTGDENVGFKTTYNYPDLTLHTTISGMAIIYNADDIIINRGNSGISIHRPQNNLNISDNIEALKRQSLLNQNQQRGKLLFSMLAPDTLQLDYNDAVSQLQEAIINSDETTRNKAKLSLAEYYLSQGLGTNALTVLNELASTKAPEVESNHYHLLRGVANYLARRYDEALNNLSYGSLPSSEEGQFWQRVISGALEPHNQTNDFLVLEQPRIRDYPSEIRRRIALTGIPSAIQAQDDLTLQNYIDTIRGADNNTNKDALLSYYTAQKLEILGYPLNAIREYRNTAGMNSAQYSALARRNIVNLQRRSRTISNERAIAEYEMLRFAWGEKEFKINILNLLADLYVETKNYDKALQTLQDLKLISGPQSEDSINRRMVKIFEDIYLNNYDESLPAVKSLALYQDFEWLAPMSAHYNQIVQKLADRLVAVDLLDRALYLLSSQIKNGTLSPWEKATIGTRIALIDLFQNKPEQALEILDATEHDSLSPEILAHRRIIRAKALSATNQPTKALELLANDYSKNGILMKSEIFWSNGQWGEAADSIKYLIEKPEAGKPLSQEQIQYVLDWATSLKKAGRETVIVRLRNTFEPFFKDTPYYSAFNVLTRTLDENKIDLNSIDKAINDVASFSNFARIYAQNLQNSSFSETIKE